MRGLILRSLALVAFLAFVPAPAAAAPQAVFAEGTVQYSLHEESGIPPSCNGEGHFTVTWEAVSRRMLVSGVVVGCAPAASLISACQGLADGTIRCFHSGIDITLHPDGRLDYVWAGDGFHEEIQGTLTRRV